ncbi:hypothetical protein M9Y10_006278 [Tritrichomonas musculus]|uniref:Uncharacterized protein n=1 Tax=Tritrichomonas musculus TaxID=1915356 RepID=A0ABR2JES4_9EUKA
MVIYKTALDYAKQHNYEKIVELLTKGITQIREEKLQNQQKAFDEKLRNQQNVFENQKKEFDDQMNQIKLMLGQMTGLQGECAKPKEDLTASANNENNKE